MKPLYVNGGDLRTFHGQTLVQSIESVERLLRNVPSAHVPGDAYTMTSPGQIAQAGHARHVNELSERLEALRRVLHDLGGRVRWTHGAYQQVEGANEHTARRVEI